MKNGSMICIGKTTNQLQVSFLSLYARLFSYSVVSSHLTLSYLYCVLRINRSEGFAIEASEAKFSTRLYQHKEFWCA
jgi:hypothetical protein